VHAPRRVHHPGDEKERHGGDARALARGGGQRAMDGVGRHGEGGIGKVVGHGKSWRWAAAKPSWKRLFNRLFERQAEILAKARAGCLQRPGLL
jgi:hypothetical protein